MHIGILFSSTLLISLTATIPLSCEAGNGNVQAEKDDDRRPWIELAGRSSSTTDGDTTTTTTTEDASGSSPVDIESIEIVTYELQVEENAGFFCSYEDLLLIGDRLWMDQWGDDYNLSTLLSFDYSPKVLRQVIMHDEHDLVYYGRGRVLMEEGLAKNVTENVTVPDENVTVVIEPPPPNVTEVIEAAAAANNVTEVLENVKKLIPNETHKYRYAAVISFPVPPQNRSDGQRGLEAREFGEDYDYGGWNEFGGFGEFDYGGGWWDGWAKPSIDVTLLRDFDCLATATLAWLVPIANHTDPATQTTEHHPTPTEETNVDNITTYAEKTYDYSDDLGFHVTFFREDNMDGLLCSKREVNDIGNVIMDAFTSTDWFGDPDIWLDYVWPVEQDITRVERFTTTTGGTTTYVDQLTIFFQGLLCTSLRHRRELTGETSILSGDLAEIVNFEIGKLIRSDGFECLDGTTSVEVDTITPDRSS